MTDFWLISVPLDKTSLTSVEKLKRTIVKTNLASSCCKFSIPDLKVGVLDSLLSVSDDLSKLDTLAESVIKKTCQCMKEVLESSDKVLENALANGDHSKNQRAALSPLKAYLKSLRVDLMNFMIKFQWDKAKYPTSLTLSSLAEIINKEVSQVEAELKSRSAAYNSVKASLQNLEHKLDGNLQTCSLNDVVRKEDLVVSEYLTTLLVVVARGSYSQWERSYESLSKFVVPRSSRKLYENGEGGVFSVTLFKRAVCEFKAKAQESKFFVRDYSFDLEEQKQREIMQLSFHKKEQYGIFVRWLKVNFSEVFVAWIHLKALRVFVESVLRYGLPVNYQALLLQTDRKHSKKLKEELASLFVHLDPTASITDVSCDIPGLCQQEYFSYICFHISTNVLDIS
ncbi:V-type proton ATPase subunit C 1-B-like isoform X1 [Astatotilapia calliptera]|uniref:V-type proton ATPase subunit C 1-B-like isoform X1 n=2 Tax=Astatotilapia calliptera TaxID=8154 RepID=UPI000E422AD0|nr:V-type proton ATPase subunit C 1-B-like isoform X1 [Astatotilapia calliptera]XP_026007965.1 V-type proton ATPase subunit C 1-B-like isoform X1 [Astatotilapia calliptera]XP_026007966.1 V-type proton ATPase subunit C 1-B-like isoform X1 [Astatotilapia calliptera]